MTSSCRWCGRVGLAAGALVVCSVAVASGAEVLTADRAVQIALRKSPQVVNAGANVLEARSGLYSSAGGLAPHLSAGLARSGSWLSNRSGQEVFGGIATPPRAFNESDYSTSPQVTGSWSILNLSSLAGFSAAQHGLRAARLEQTATRNDVALSVRRQFYIVVRAIHLARVNSEALHLARDDERRVRALFEVGSVSKSDVLKAQVRTAQSQLDSLTAINQISVQRSTLASDLGVEERAMGDIDTTLAVIRSEFHEDALLQEASRNRPDIQAAEAELRAAKASRRSARFARLPYVAVSGSAQFGPRSSSKTTETNAPPPDTSSVARSETDAAYRATLSLNWDFFDGFAADARNAAAQARLERAIENRDALRRNLSAEVHLTLLTYSEALESWDVAQRADESATENLKLTQQKYNVGSATILDLIDAQVQLQRAQNQEVSARADVRVAEAAIRRVSGRGE